MPTETVQGTSKISRAELGLVSESERVAGLYARKSVLLTSLYKDRENVFWRYWIHYATRAFRRFSTRRGSSLSRSTTDCGVAAYVVQLPAACAPPRCID